MTEPKGTIQHPLEVPILFCNHRCACSKYFNHDATEPCPPKCRACEKKR